MKRCACRPFVSFSKRPPFSLVVDYLSKLLLRNSWRRRSITTNWHTSSMDFLETSFFSMWAKCGNWPLDCAEHGQKVKSWQHEQNLNSFLISLSSLNAYDYRSRNGLVMMRWSWNADVFKLELCFLSGSTINPFDALFVGPVSKSGISLRVLFFATFCFWACFRFLLDQFLSLFLCCFQNVFFFS